MLEKRDYFDYWNRTRKDKFSIYDREKVALKIISKIIRGDESILDVGCGYGKFIRILSKKFSGITLKGVDYSKKEVKDARKMGLDVSIGDVEKGIDFRSESFDILFAGEFIEHLYNPDFFLAESNRVLKKNGFLILTTPNLCAWFNRVLMFVGIQPLFLEPSTKSKLIGAGPLKKFKKESTPVGHVRIFCIDAIRDLLKENGFKMIKVKGAIYDQGLPKKLFFIDRLFKFKPSLSSILVVLAKKY